MNQLEWLANLIDAAPRLESGNYSKLITSIHKLLSDPKTPVVTIVVKLMGLFALKLRLACITHVLSQLLTRILERSSILLRRNCVPFIWTDSKKRSRRYPLS